MYFEDEFDLTAERNPNPGRYIPTQEEMERWERARDTEEELRELESRRRAAQNGTP